MNQPSIHPETTQAQSELESYLTIRNQRRRLFPRAALVGLIAGLMASGFRATLAYGDQLRHQFLTWSHTFTWGWIWPLLLTPAIAMLAVWLVQAYAPEASGSGIPHLEAVLRRFREFRWKRVLPIKFIGGLLALGSGLVLGREGPTVQMGGAVGMGIASRMKVSYQESLILAAAGAGAGLAAAFNAPLSGVVFVLEELQRDFRPAVFGSAFIAAVIADIVARFMAGQYPVFSIPSYPVQPLSALWAFALLGVIAGFAGVIYNTSLIRLLNQTSRLSSRNRMIWVFVVAASIALTAWFYPQAVGGGHDLTELTLQGQLALASIPLWLGLRYILNLTSYTTSAPGGIFAPLLSLGALLGLAIGLIAHQLAPTVISHPAVFAIVGMAALFTAIVRAPLTAIVLIIEMTGNYSHMLALLVSCFCAYVTAEMLGNVPIYEALLARDLDKQTPVFQHTEPQVLEFEIQPNALFEGKLIRNLHLPKGCIIVRIKDSHFEHIPTADSRLERHMRLTVVIDSSASEAINLLHAGCRHPAH